jgi:hypothetical protein
MQKYIDVLLPPAADNRLRGSQLPLYLLVLTAAIGTVRSCIHLLAPDGGAGSIAGMDLSVAGANGIVFAFALWGSSQLIYAVIQLLVTFRYRSLVPFMWLLLILETFLRELVGHLKPVHFAHTPPGAIGNYVYLPLASLMLALGLWSGSKQPQ